MRHATLLLLAARRLVLPVAFVTAATGVVQAQPHVGNAPWCTNVMYYGGIRDCAFYSFEQCMQTAIGLSNACERNPWYVPERPQRRRPVRRHHRDRN